MLTSDGPLHHLDALLDNQESYPAPEFRPGINMISNEELLELNPLYQRLIDGDPDAYYPWIENLEEIAEEEAAIPIPSGYSYALYTMQTEKSQLLAEYKELLKTHVTDEFAAAVPILQFMLEEGVKVFTGIHMNWKGIQGIPLFELEWRKDTPAVLKPKCRPIRKAIYDNAEKEFRRLLGYLLYKSDSSVGSNIVVASKSTFSFIRICGDYVKINEFII